LSLRAQRSNPIDNEISSELAYAFGIPLQGFALRNDNYWPKFAVCPSPLVALRSFSEAGSGEVAESRNK